MYSLMVLMPDGSTPVLAGSMPDLWAVGMTLAGFGRTVELRNEVGEVSELFAPIAFYATVCARRAGIGRHAA